MDDTRLREVLPEVTACAPTVRSRLLLAWALGSGIPLAGIALTLIQQQGADHTRLFILLGLLTGAPASWSGRTPACWRPGRWPIHCDSAQDDGAGRRRRPDGAVPIADSGEIGDLQLRINRMTAGLRERERLRELFGRHVGTDVARYAIDNSDLGGESREVSVLFIDLRGSTALAEKLAPGDRRPRQRRRAAVLAGQARAWPSPRRRQQRRCRGLAGESDVGGPR